MRINEITVADDPDAWRSAGFSVDEDRVVIGRSFVIRLTGQSEGGVTSWTLGVDGRARAITSQSGGLSMTVDAASKPDVLMTHENGVSHCLKAVILTDNTAACMARLQSEVPELGKPPHEGHGDNDIHYALWTLDDCEWGLEVACLDPNQGPDIMTMIVFVVDDLDAAIDRIGANDLTEVSMYGGRRIVGIKPETGVTPGISLIAKA